MGSILGIIGIGLGIIGIAGSYFAAKDQQKALDRQAVEENKVRELEFRKQAIKERREKFKFLLKTYSDLRVRICGLQS